jgi:CHAD domain-containing protein
VPRPFTLHAAEIMSHGERVDRFADRAPRTQAREVRPPLMLALPRVGPNDPAGHAVYAALREAILRIAASEADAKRGDAEAIHRVRTTTRRLRSELDALGSLVDKVWHEQTEEELRWLAGQLGGVRDLDVLMARLKKAAQEIDPTGSSQVSLTPLFETLEARHARAAQALNDALRSDRYRSLVAALQHAAERPALTEAASEPCRAALPPAAATAWRRLKRGGRDLRRSDPDEEFHQLRKRAKRVRYTSELIAPVMGRSVANAAGRFIQLVTQVQNALGEHQDAVVAGQEIEQVLAEHPDETGFVQTATRLLESQNNAAEDARGAFFKIWAKLDRKKIRRWMKFSSKVNAGA